MWLADILGRRRIIPPSAPRTAALELDGGRRSSDCLKPLNAAWIPIYGRPWRGCPHSLCLIEMTRDPVSSSNYDLFEQAMRIRKQVFCMYDGYPRELCPIILGHSQGQENALTYQFGGQSRSGLPPGGQWRCLWLAKVSNVQLRDGPWFVGCVFYRDRKSFWLSQSLVARARALTIGLGSASPYKGELAQVYYLQLRV